MATSIKQRVFSGTIWMAMVSAVQQVLQFGIQIALARLLIPNDYGTAALVMTIGSFAIVLSSAGIASAIVQRKEMTDRILDAAALITGCVALVLGGILFVTSHLWANFFAVPEVTFLLRVVAIDVVLKVLLSLYDAIMLRRLQYRSLALRSLIGLIVQASVAIGLAWMGWGPKALVIGYVSGSAVQLVLCILATRYVPRSWGDFSSVKGIFQFGAWVLLGRIANQMAMTLDSMIVARLLNVLSLGLYNVAKSLTQIAPSFFTHLVGRVTLPVFSRHQDDRAWLEENYWRGLRLNMMVCFPFCVLIFLFSREALMILYGSKWLAAADVMRVCTIGVALQSLDAGYSGTVYAAIGKPKYSLIILGASLLILPSFSYLGSFYGLMGYAWAVNGACVVFFCVTLTVMHTFIGFKIRRFLPYFLRQVVTLIPMLLCGWGLLHLWFSAEAPVPVLFSSFWFGLVGKSTLAAFICMTVYGVTCCLLQRSLVSFLIDGMRRKK